MNDELKRALDDLRAIGSEQATEYNKCHGGRCGNLEDRIEAACNTIEATLAAPSVPDAMPIRGRRDEYSDGWNACRAATLSAGARESVSVPDGWKLVPVELTEAMEAAGHAEYEKAMLGNRRNVTAACRRQWSAMVKASPSPPVSAQAAYDAPRCPSCGYTLRDCREQMDHHLCGQPDPPPKCAMCNDHGAVGNFAQDGSFDGRPCPDCEARESTAPAQPAVGEAPEPVAYRWRQKGETHWNRWASIIGGSAPHFEDGIFEVEYAYSPPARVTVDEAMVERAECAWHASWEYDKRERLRRSLLAALGEKAS